ncbi:MAG TPA: hypothetical protein VMU14_13345 [Acidimicrobiales bacterium]|nr:hypothetical protein [Acidimicrobiales bacterium]
MSRVQVLVPTPPPEDEATSLTYALGAPVRGARVGLRLDTAWRSYEFVVDEWSRRLAEDGAEVVTLVTGERAGPHADQTRTDLDDWSRLVDCAVVGLGN